MPNVGRGVTTRKTRVDEVLKLDLADFRRLGLCVQSEKQAGVVTWRRAQQITGRIFCSFEALAEQVGSVRLCYTILRAEKTESRDLDYRIPLVKSPCHFGGRRLWFICLLIKDGRPCGRRCRVLYLPDGAVYFGCRLCYELTYEGRQRHRERFYEGFERPYDRRERAEEKFKRARKPEKLAAYYQQIVTEARKLAAYFGKWNL